MVMTNTRVALVVGICSVVTQTVTETLDDCNTTGSSRHILSTCFCVTVACCAWVFIYAIIGVTMIYTQSLLCQHITYIRVISRYKEVNKTIDHVIAPIMSMVMTTVYLMA